MLASLSWSLQSDGQSELVPGTGNRSTGWEEATYGHLRGLRSTARLLSGPLQERLERGDASLSTADPDPLRHRRVVTQAGTSLERAASN